MNEPSVDELAEFINTNWTLVNNRTYWLAALHKNKWQGAHWPVKYGGTEWRPSRQLAFINLKAEAFCPLPDDTFGIIAPALMHRGTTAQIGSFLPGILNGECSWSIVVDRELMVRATNKGWLITGQLSPTKATHLCLIIADQAENQTLLLCKTPNRHYFNNDLVTHDSILGTIGEGSKLLHSQYSAPLILQELKTTFAYILRCSKQNIDARTQSVSESEDDDTAEMRLLAVKIAALEGLFLNHADSPTIGLLGSELRIDSISLLSAQLGYYALINPDPSTTGNEPLPYESERAYLHQIGQLYSRDPVLQRDLIARHTGIFSR